VFLGPEECYKQISSLITVVCYCAYRSLAKRAHGRCTLLWAQTTEWADICDIAAF